MPLFVTPRQLTVRAELYRQLGQLTGAGIGLIQALELQRASASFARERALVSHLLARLQSGESLATAVQGIPRWLPSFEAAVLHAAEYSGRLPESFAFLARHYEEKAGLARQMFARAAYPIFVLHLAVLLFPLSGLQGLVLRADVTGFLVQKVGLLAPVYLVVAAIVMLGRETCAPAWRAMWERVTGLVPQLGPAQRDMALSRLAAVLEGLLSAGVPVLQSWEIAGAASGSPALEREVDKIRSQIEVQATPAEAIRRSRVFPSTFATQYATGELSGKLDETLRWLHSYYQEEGTRKWRRFVALSGAVLYGSVVLVVAWQVIGFYLRYFQQIGDLSK